MSEVAAAFNLRKKYKIFRILIIGRANSGKTTLLKRVCNSDEDPCIYDRKGGNLVNPTEERGVHDINQGFIFRSNPEFVFHDSPGFEAGTRDELNQVLLFIEERAKAINPDDQLHVIWFCFTLGNKARLFLDLERQFFNIQHSGNVPVIAIYTKFDDLVSQMYMENKSDGFVAARSNAELWLAKKLQEPLFASKFPPKADVCLEEMDDDEGNHQEQVKLLIDKTASSLDSSALKMLFVSNLENNLEVCVKSAIQHGLPVKKKMDVLVASCLTWFPHSFNSHPKFKKGRRLLLTDHIIQQIVESLSDKLKNSSLLAMAVILICCHGSFWIQFISGVQVSFVDAFKQALANVKSRNVLDKVSAAIEEMNNNCNDHCDVSQIKDLFASIVLNNCINYIKDISDSENN